jgi:hypothetical protein
VPEPVKVALLRAAITFTEPLRYDHLGGCYMGTVVGITVGVELNGYIHS